MQIDDSALLAGLRRYVDSRPAAAVRGLEPLALILTDAMQADPAHGDVTSATHTNYAAKVYGPGKDPSADTRAQAAVVEQLNPGESETQTITVPDASVGMILDSATSYQRDLEVDSGGRKAVLTPTLQGSVDDFTRFAAEGLKRA